VDVLHTCESIFLKFAGVFQACKSDLKSFPAFYKLGKAFLEVCRHSAGLGKRFEKFAKAKITKIS